MDVYDLKAPEHGQHGIPLVLDSPHSGSVYPNADNILCDPLSLRLARDSYVDDLFSHAPKLGAAFLCAQIHRCYIDLNRPADDIDPLLINHPWPDKKYGPIAPTQRSNDGFGLIHRIVKAGVKLHETPLSPAEIMNRIETVYKPYHDTLQKLLDDAHYNYGRVWHINCHSMPESTAVPKKPFGITNGIASTVDFVIGNQDGKTAGKEFSHLVREFLKARGYIVSMNDPFRGVECVERHGDPQRERHSIQLEVNRALYMCEETGEKTENYVHLKKDIKALLEHTANYVKAQLIPRAAD